MASGIPSTTAHLAAALPHAFLWTLPRHILRLSSIPFLGWPSKDGMVSLRDELANDHMHPIMLHYFVVESVPRVRVQGTMYSVHGNGEGQLGENWINITKDFTEYLQVFVIDVVLVRSPNTISSFRAQEGGRYDLVCSFTYDHYLPGLYGAWGNGIHDSDDMVLNLIKEIPVLHRFLDLNDISIFMRRL